jgi:hypothetical protein
MKMVSPPTVQDIQHISMRIVHPRRHRTLQQTLLRENIEIVQHIREGRFQRSLSLIAGFSALLGGLEVTLEHYRGSYGQRVMYSPIFLSPLLFVAGLWGTFSRRIARTLLPISSLAMLADGLLGFFFHIRGVQRKPGGWRIPVFNIVMGPPLFAPLLLGIAGFLGVIASMLRREDDPVRLKLRGSNRRNPAWMGLIPRRIRREGITLEQDVHEGRFQRVLALATALSAILNGIEALYSHYRNRFQYRVQWTPILLSPLVTIAGIGAFWRKSIARTWLPFTSALALINGGIGFLYHARGALRRPGGIRQPVHTLLYGPPLFAPLLYSATGFLGLLASLLRRAD